MSPFSYDEFKSENVKFVEKGQVVEGRILNIEPFQGMNNKKHFKYDLQLPDGRRASLICSQTDLKAKLAELCPQVGDTIRVEYIEDKHVGQPEPMKVFKVGCVTNAAAPTTQTTDNDGSPF